MKVIGLTGGIGSGKSTVSRFMADLGAVVIDADKVGHEAFEPGTELWREVVAAFGRQVLTPSGAIDRARLGEVVFGKLESLSCLNAIMHPRMYNLIKGKIEAYRRQGVAVVVLEAPLLIEAEWTALVDEVWVTVAAEATVLKRLAERAGLSREESLARVRAQLPAAERVKHADVVIDTDCPIDELQSKVAELWQRFDSGLHNW